MGLLLRIVYYTDHKKFFLIHISNIFLVTIFHPYYAYKNFIKHKTDLISILNSKNNIPESVKKKIKRRLNSKFRTIFRVIWISIIYFKPILDSHITLLNTYYKENGIKVLLKIKVVVDIKPKQNSPEDSFIPFYLNLQNQN